MVFVHQTDMESLSKTCPPQSADEGNVDPVYRFIENDTIQEIDFKTHKQRKKKYPPYKACEALALSFFTSEEAVKKATDKFPNLQNKKVITGKITTEYGRHQTKRGHLNLWQYQGVNLMDVFVGEE
jgi:hypothetical protein